MKTALALAAVLAFSFTAVGSEAATSSMMAKKPSMMAAKTGPCKDAKGKFMKCPAAAPKGPCKDAKGKFIKCSAATPAKP